MDINILKSYGSVLHFYGSYQRKEISMLLSQSNSREVSFYRICSSEKTFCVSFQNKEVLYGTDEE